MILNRYVQRNIYLGTLGAMLLLVSISMFFVIVRELDDIGRGGYGVPPAIEFVLFSLPGKVTESLPLAALLGSMLSLGALAANSEIIAMQASGMSIGRLVSSVMQAAAVMALVGFLLGNWIVPDSQTRLRDIHSLMEGDSGVLHSSEGIWIKDGSRVIRIGALLPQGHARDIDIFDLDGKGRLVASTHAEQAVPVKGGWQLQQVRKAPVGPSTAGVETFQRLQYPGNLSLELLQVLTIKPRMMSIEKLFAYLSFLDDNRLDSRAERLILWKKIVEPFTVFIMCLLAIPFVLGSQRQSGSGQRMLIGILLGLAYVVCDRLFTQLGSHLQLYPLVIALFPDLVFLLLAVYLLLRKLSLGAGAGVWLFAR